jgi:MFS transporter, UMF1 family
VSIVVWMLICTAVYKFVYVPFDFYLTAAFVGMVMGGIQSLSRSTYSKLLPPTNDHASYFSFYDVCDKVGTVLGTFIFGYINEITGSMRQSIVALIVFFIIGIILLLRVQHQNRILEMKFNN